MGGRYAAEVVGTQMFEQFVHELPTRRKPDRVVFLMNSISLVSSGLIRVAWY
jgi:hypothetical protein